MLKQVVTMLGATALMLALVSGCGDDEKTTASNPPAANSQIELIDMGALIEAVCPPEYSAPVSVPNGTDSLGNWTGGDHPLLENVFGSTEPEALYSNINSFKSSFEIITSVLEVDADGNIIAGTYVDSAYSETPEDPMMLHFTVVVTALTDSTVLPVEAQEVIGTSLDIDYLLNISLEEWPDAILRIGMTVNDNEQTLIQFDEGMDKPGNTASRLIYGSLNPVDSTFVFKGIGFCEHEGGERFTYAFGITSAATSEFSYRVSWYSNGSIEFDILNCIIGGGNKDEEFALRYRMFAPADTNVCDSFCMYDQVFGPDYSEGTGLISAYEQYIDESLIFPYEVVPQAMLTNPWE